MQQVSRKPSESFENLVRRFNRKVQQSGVLSDIKKRQYFEKGPSKKELRETAIRKAARKAQKTTSLLLKGY